jgi:C1A family cysteine protease
MIKKILSCFMAASLIFCNIARSEDGIVTPIDNPVVETTVMGTGLIVDTPEQALEFKKKHKRIKKVHLNGRGVKRVNAERRKNKKKEITAPVVSDNADDLQTEKFGAIALPDLMSLLPSETAGAVPTSVDNSLNVWFPPIGNQGSIASCVSWATTYYQLSYMEAMSKNVAINTGNKAYIYSPQWTYNFVNDGVNAGSGFYNNYAVIEKSGAANLIDVPYTGNYLAWSVTSKVWERALNARSNPVQYVQSISTPTGLALTKQLLTNGYILVFGTYVNSWQMKPVKDDISTTEDTAFIGQTACYQVNGVNGAHAMTIVGYNDNLWVDINGNGLMDAGEKGALKIANQWGTGYGNKGFYWLTYDALKKISEVVGLPASTTRQEALFGNLAYQLTIKPNYKPKMVAKFVMQQPIRNQSRVFLGTGPTTTAIPDTYFFNGTLNFLGGTYAFDGTKVGVNGNFVLDLTDAVILPASINVDRKFYIGTSDKVVGSPTTIASYEIADLVSNVVVKTTLVPMTNDSGNGMYTFVNYKYTGLPLYPMGDVSGDKLVTTADVALVDQCVATDNSPPTTVTVPGFPPVTTKSYCSLTPSQKLRADVDYDSFVTSSDSTIITNYINGKITKL